MRLLLLLPLLASACDDPEPALPVGPVQGALIDGSEDPAAALIAAGGDSALPAAVAYEVGEVEPPVARADGTLDISFGHLSLAGLDVDSLIDYLLFPEEFEEDEIFVFPESIQALDGKRVAVKGYMLPGEVTRGYVRDFMLVRDLAGCCFGGSPGPDEWIDVVMEGEREAEYLRYVPMVVEGRFELVGGQDPEGYATGVFHIEATSAVEAD